MRQRHNHWWAAVMVPWELALLLAPIAAVFKLVPEQRRRRLSAGRIVATVLLALVLAAVFRAARS